MQGQVFDQHKWNFLIKDNLVIPNIVVRNKLFSYYTEELSIVQDTLSKKYGFINWQGDLVIPCVYQHVKDFSEGLAAVMDSKTNKWGYINEKNEVIAPFIYDWASSFNYDFYDKPGFIGIAYVNIGILNEDKGKMFPGGKWGLINRQGEEILPAKYGHISEVIENMAFIIDGGRFDFPTTLQGKSWDIHGKMGFINNKGEIVIPLEFDININAYFEHGTVTLRKNGMDFILNWKGEIINK